MHKFWARASGVLVWDTEPKILEGPANAPKQPILRLADHIFGTAVEML
jgi:hypothetical protein